MDKFTHTKSEISKLTGGKKERAELLLEKAKFMNEELAKLQEFISKNGWTEIYQNGANQCGKKKCSEGEAYNVIIKNYASVMKQIEDILASVPAEEDALEAFLSDRT